MASDQTSKQTSKQTSDRSSTMWVPVCCGRVMRCNMFRQADGGSYAALVCSVCNKNITLEQEPAEAANKFGEGSKILSLIGSPKPPKTERKKSLGEASADDPTLQPQCCSLEIFPAHDWPDHFALSHCRTTRRRRDGRGIQGAGQPAGSRGGPQIPS